LGIFTVCPHDAMIWLGIPLSIFWVG